MKKLIEDYFEQNKGLMIRDIMRLVRIKSDKEEAKAGKPYGDGPAEVLQPALRPARRRMACPL